MSADTAVPAAYRNPEAIEFYQRPISEGIWKNEVTLRSTRLARMYEPGQWIGRISPTPLLLVVADDDRLTLTDIELAAFERALQPKKLVLIKGGHFAPYLGQFEQSAGAALDWFISHLA